MSWPRCLPRISVAALLVEVDARTGFLDSLSHADGKVTRSGELKRNLIYVLIAEATNMGADRDGRGMRRAL